MTRHDGLPSEAGDQWIRYRRRCSCGWQTGWTFSMDADHLLAEHLAECAPEQAEKETGLSFLTAADNGTPHLWVTG